MWIILAFVSAALLGFYDVAKKQALRNNAVPVVLLLNTLFRLFFSLRLLSLRQAVRVGSRVRFLRLRRVRGTTIC